MPRSGFITRYICFSNFPKHACISSLLGWILSGIIYKTWNKLFSVFTLCHTNEIMKSTCSHVRIYNIRRVSSRRLRRQRNRVSMKRIFFPPLAFPEFVIDSDEDKSDGGGNFVGSVFGASVGFCSTTVIYCYAWQEYSFWNVRDHFLRTKELIRIRMRLNNPIVVLINLIVALPTIWPTDAFVLRVESRKACDNGRFVTPIILAIVNLHWLLP